MLEIILVLVCLSFEANAQCVDENGEFVDWVTMYKFPKETNLGKETLLGQGLAYAYISSSHPHKDWTLSELSVKDPKSIPGRILSPIYKNDPDQFHMLYNDEHPNGNTSFTLGHTKGVLVLNEKYGFWMIHSVPKYPPTLENSYDYPHTGQMYGQSFLCISLLTPTSAEGIGQQMMYNSPYLYSVNIPKWTSKNYPILTSAASGTHVKKGKSFNILTFSSLGGHSFTSFAKAKHFGQDLYFGLVAPNLKTNLMVESWPNGAGKMKSNCDGKFQVENIDALDFEIKSKIKFTTHKDHSKWAVTYDENSHLGMSDTEKYVCIGDINRMETQKKRGGGTVCFVNKDLWKYFTKIVKSVEACPRF